VTDAAATEPVGVAVIGAGMAGRSHAHAYRTAQTVFGTGAPPVRLVAIADINAEFAAHTAQRYGFERAETSWQAVAEAADIDAVSVVVANHLHRPIAEALLAAGKHVLCEKPLAPSGEDAEAMVGAAQAAGKVASCGFSYRRSQAVSAIGDQMAAHPYIAAAQSMPFSGIGHGGQEYFTYQARAFLDQIAGLDRLPAQASFADGLRNLRVEEAIVQAAVTGSAVKVGP
jgi:predicted dehydrogenase